ncbi:MAG: UDP-N-acetylmuramoyl-L-alanyl-D-glutamate--2,6-diaminopimelate ligase, partial [Desulfobacteraceae bacterium]|nr:UDP-N-acetylmuramoyl-L-alanyl-D-glutamate--2,6-diaminopimelate ligase [Desulfobacteraceae bacterium]
MQLKHLIDGITVTDSEGDLDLEVTSIAYDSRTVKPGALFVALKGHTQDGHHFIKDAVSKGAVAVVSELPPASFADQQPDRIAAEIQVPDSRQALSRLAVTFFDSPFKKINLIGITGTNGKTTTAYLLESILAAAGKRPGV